MQRKGKSIRKEGCLFFAYFFTLEYFSSSTIQRKNRMQFEGEKSIEKRCFAISLTCLRKGNVTSSTKNSICFSIDFHPKLNKSKVY